MDDEVSCPSCGCSIDAATIAHVVPYWLDEGEGEHLCGCGALVIIVKQKRFVARVEVEVADG